MSHLIKPLSFVCLLVINYPWMLHCCKYGLLKSMCLLQKSLYSPNPISNHGFRTPSQCITAAFSNLSGGIVESWPSPSTCHCRSIAVVWLQNVTHPKGKLPPFKIGRSLLCMHYNRVDVRNGSTVCVCAFENYLLFLKLCCPKRSNNSRD